MGHCFRLLFLAQFLFAATRSRHKPTPSDLGQDFADDGPLGGGARDVRPGAAAQLDQLGHQSWGRYLRDFV